ncbi:hypothetical protein WIS52_11860 [Pseudonocardia nematodicida]|uniref:Plasmid replication, integration and excision activator n=1 Tax=Pseudonocardia nematodicida TaxID=1206997 RepID=A0ABV1KC34_9PSEU
MRSIPVDTSKVQFIGTGKVAERAEYVQLSDGSRKRSGNQAKDETTGLPVFVVDVLVNDPENNRAEIAGVKIAAAEAPQTQLGQPVQFRDLVAVPWVDDARRVQMSFRAAGIEIGGHGRGHKPAENAA